jgi:hypothetical protein
LEGFTENIRGAVGAAVAGFAIATASLASQVPIVGESFAGVAAILSAFGLQVDQLARQLGAGGLNDRLFDAANFINDLDGAAGDIAGTFAVLATAVAGVVGPLGLLKARALGASGSIQALKAGFKTGVKQAGRFAAALLSVPGAFAAVAAAVFGFFAAYALGIGDIRQQTDSFASNAEASFESFLRNIRQSLLGIKQSIKNGFKTGVNIITSAFNSAYDEVNTFASDSEDRFETFLLNVRGKLLEVKEDIVGFFADIGDTIRDSIPKLRGDGGILDFDLGLGLGNDNSDTNTGGGNTTTGSSPATGQSGTSTGPSIDGRVLIESTGRQRRDLVARNGTGL